MGIVNTETVVMMGAALAAAGNVQGQEAVQAAEKTISWEEAQNLARDSLRNDLYAQSASAANGVERLMDKYNSDKSGDLADTLRADSAKFNENRNGAPIKDAEGQTVAYFFENQGLVYALFPTKEQEAAANKYMDNVNEGIFRQNQEKVSRFQATDTYKQLGEEERIIATHQFRQEHKEPYYLAGNDSVLDKIRENESPVRAFMQTQKYQELGEADRIIALGEFSKKVCPPEISESIDTQTFLHLKYGMDKFDYASAKTAANHMREHYMDGYDKQSMEESVRNSMLLSHEPLSQENVEKRMAQASFGASRKVDREATEGVMRAIDRDGNLSAQEKENLKLGELRDYCQRIDNDSRFSSQQDKEQSKQSMLRNYPELAQKLTAEQQRPQNGNMGIAQIAAMKQQMGR